jgi:hypothetical protein
MNPAHELLKVRKALIHCVAQLTGLELDQPQEMVQLRVHPLSFFSFFVIFEVLADDLSADKVDRQPQKIHFLVAQFRGTKLIDLFYKCRRQLPVGIILAIHKESFSGVELLPGILELSKKAQKVGILNHAIDHDEKLGP